MLELELDDDGYPTEDAEKIIEQSHAPVPEIFEAMRKIWQYASCGYWSEQSGFSSYPRKKVRRYFISTAGWSGNESLIDAFRRNIWWSMVWVSERRGGHFTFEVQKGSLAEKGISDREWEESQKRIEEIMRRN